MSRLCAIYEGNGKDPGKINMVKGVEYIKPSIQDLFKHLMGRRRWVIRIAIAMIMTIFTSRKYVYRYN